jgi:hypothetical protein
VRAEVADSRFFCSTQRKNLLIANHL